MLPTLEAPELIFGICSPIGTNNRIFVDILSAGLKKYSYHPEYFKVTTLMRAVELDTNTLVETPVESKYDSRIQYANKLRELFESTSVLSMMCCAAVRAYRRKKAVVQVQQHTCPSTHTFSTSLRGKRKLMR